MKPKRTVLFIISILCLSSILNAQDQEDRLIKNGFLRANIFASIPWLSVGLHFAAGGILSADGEYGMSDYMISTSILELSSAPLFAFEPRETFYGLAATSVLPGTEALTAHYFGTDGYLTGYLHWPRLSLTEYRAYRSYSLARLDSTMYDNSGFKAHDLMTLYTAPLNINVLVDEAEMNEH